MCSPRVVTTTKRRCLASLILAKTHPLLYRITTNRSRFCTSRFPRVMHDGSFVSESWCITQAICLPHLRKCDVVSYLLMALVMSDIGKVQYRSRYHGWKYRGAFANQRNPPKAPRNPSVERKHVTKDHDITINN